MTAVSEDAIHEVSTWEDVHFVLRSRSFEQVAPEDDYHEGTVLQGKIIGDSVVMARGPAHLERRRLESVLFRIPTLVAYENELVKPRLATILARLEADRGADRVVRGDLVAISQAVLLEVMAKLVGVDVSTPEREDRFRELFVRLDDGSRVRHMVDMHKALEEGLAVQKLFGDEFFRPAWEEHEQLLADVEAGRRPETDVPNDLITLMQRNREHFEQWDEGVYLREATLYVVASTGTTTREIGLCFDVLERWLESHPEDAELRTDPDFLAAAFVESCRLHQSIQDVGRTATEDVTLPSGMVVRKGQPVRVSLVKANRDVVGSSAESFDPRRADPAVGDRAGLAFSDGRHQCIGKILVLGSGNDDNRLGTAVTILQTLYEAGMRADPSTQPTLKATTTKRFATYPIVLTGL
jgi:cytochrome P450